MAVGERIGEAFVEIGGDNSKLRRDLGESFKLVNQSMNTLASLSKSFGDNITRNFEGVTKALTGGGGLLSALASILDVMSGIARESLRLQQALQRVGASSGVAAKIKSDVVDAVAGTPFTAREGARAATILAKTIRAPEILQALELSIGATQRFPGLTLEAAAGQVGQAFAGKGDPFGFGLQGPLAFRRAILQAQLGPFAEFGRDVAFKDPLLMGGRISFARIADAFAEGLAKVGPELFGGFSQQQLGDAFEATLTKTSLVGPTARGQGILLAKDIPDAMRAANRQEIAAAQAFQIGDPQKGLLDDLMESLQALIPTADAVGKAFKSLAMFIQSVFPAAADIEAFGFRGAIVNDLAEGMVESRHPLMMLLTGRDDPEFRKGFAGDLRITDLQGNPTGDPVGAGGDATFAAVKRGVMEALLEFSGRPPAHHGPVLEVIR